MRPRLLLRLLVDADSCATNVGLCSLMLSLTAAFCASTSLHPLRISKGLHHYFQGFWLHLRLLQRSWSFPQLARPLTFVLLLHSILRLQQYTTPTVYVISKLPVLFSSLSGAAS